MGTVVRMWFRDCANGGGLELLRGDVAEVGGTVLPGSRAGNGLLDDRTAHVTARVDNVEAFRAALMGTPAGDWLRTFQADEPANEELTDQLIAEFFRYIKTGYWHWELIIETWGPADVRAACRGRHPRTVRGIVLCVSPVKEALKKLAAAREDA